MEIDAVLVRLVRKYVELSDACYRVSVVAHDKHGRFRKGHHARRPHPALLKKVDLDRALGEVYRRFFGPGGQPRSSSTSNRRCQGSDAPTSTPDPSSGTARRSE